MTAFARDLSACLLALALTTTAACSKKPAAGADPENEPMIEDREPGIEEPDEVADEPGEDPMDEPGQAPIDEPVAEDEDLGAAEPAEDDIGDEDEVVEDEF